MPSIQSSARTDRELAIEADEFVWDDGGGVAAHRYLAAAICDRLAACNARTVLDLGCGNGALTAVLAAAGYEVTGCDSSRSGIDQARGRLPGTALFLHDLGADLPIDHVGRYDAVVAAEVIEHLLLPRKVMRIAMTALKPGGTFVATTPYHGYVKNLLLALTNKFDAHWHPLRDYGHVKFFSKRTFTQLFAEAGFSDVRYSTAGRLPPVACSMVVSGRRAA
jgi:2-polyprenyl-6-hydroxyphenyl methylase/3-demethylubiquinone-9 3-methyltransferase